MNRRGFLGAILAAAAAPAIVRASSLMPTRSGILVPKEPAIWTYDESEVLTSLASDSNELHSMIGKLFTIAGVEGTFKITSIAKGTGVAKVQPVIWPLLPPERFSDP